MEEEKKQKIKNLYNACVANGRILFDRIYIKEILTKYPTIEIKHMVDAKLFENFLSLSNDLSKMLNINKWPKMNNTLASALFIWEFMRDIPNNYKEYEWLGE